MKKSFGDGKWPVWQMAVLNCPTLLLIVEGPEWKIYQTKSARHERNCATQN